MNEAALVAWLKKNKPSSHTLALLGSGLVIYFKTNQQFHDYVSGIWQKLPIVVHILVMLGVFLFGLYRNPQRAAGNGQGSGLAGIVGHTLTLCLSLSLGLALMFGTVSCARYQIHPGSIPVAGDKGMFDSQTADFLSEEKAFLDDAATHPEYPVVVKNLLGTAQKQYEETKRLYLGWRALQTAENLAALQQSKSDLKGAVEKVNAAQAASTATGK